MGDLAVQLRLMEAQFNQLEHKLVEVGGRHFMHSLHFSSPVSLKKYNLLEKAIEEYKKFSEVKSYNLAYCFPPRMDGSEVYLAFWERGISLESYLSEGQNRNNLFGVNDQKPKPGDGSLYYKDHASQRFKDIIRSLVIAGKSLMLASLTCKFSFKNIFVYEEGNELHVEVADFESGSDPADMWRSLYECLVAIIDKVADYRVTEDDEMTDILKLLSIGDIENLMRSVFFWDYRQKKEFICELREILEDIDGEAYRRWDSHCEVIFKDWETKLKKDKDLKKILQHYLGKQQHSKQQYHGKQSVSSKPKPINFIRSCFVHMNETLDVINHGKTTKKEELSITANAFQRKVENALGQYTYKMASVVPQLNIFSLRSLQSFTIWKSVSK